MNHLGSGTIVTAWNLRHTFNSTSQYCRSRPNHRNVPHVAKEAMLNLFNNLPASIPKELIEVIAANQLVCIERIVSHGHTSPDGFWYDQDEHEWVIVLKGAATLRFDDGVMELKPGDFVNIPAHKRHRVDWTTPDEPTIWLAVFYKD